MLRHCYRRALESLPKEEQAEVAQRFATMVRQESSEELATYADALFSCADIGLLAERDAVIVKKHIFSRWDNTKIGQDTTGLIGALSGIGPFLEEGDIFDFVRLCLRFVLSSDKDAQANFSYLTWTEYPNLSTEDLKERFMRNLASRKESAIKFNSQPDKVKTIDNLIENCKLEIPF